jgi:hypothetical protein
LRWVRRSSNVIVRCETYIEPIDVLVPVLGGDGEVGDVRLLGVVLGVPVWLRSAGHGTGVLGVHVRHDGDDAERRIGERGGVGEKCRPEGREEGAAGSANAVQRGAAAVLSKSEFYK